MSTTQSLLRPVSSRLEASRPAKVAAKEVPQPHLYQPAADWPPADFAARFDTSGLPGYYNAGAKAAILGGDKQSRAELWLDFSRRETRLACSVADQSLLSGEWAWRATAGGKPLQPSGDWEEVCWHREEACDFLEMELPLADGWILERQAFLSRADRILVLADALLGPDTSPVEIRYQQELPLAEKVTFQGARETREGLMMSGGRPRVGIVPPALTEWRSDFCHAEFTAGEKTLKLEMAALGRALFVPLWIDLDSRRLKRPLTWRRLSVGENLQIVSRDIAAGYRLQAGREQWLLYRSLAPFGNRSVLGHNTASSFVFGRVKKNGQVEDVLSIEQ